VEVCPSTPEKREQAPNRTGKTRRYPSAGGRPREAFGVLRLAVALEVEVCPSTPEKREQAPNRTGKTRRYPASGGRPREAFGVLPACRSFGGGSASLHTGKAGASS
jgi:hypothetical protein